MYRLPWTIVFLAGCRAVETATLELRLVQERDGAPAAVSRVQL
jgi:hypothetical protein